MRARTTLLFMMLGTAPLAVPATGLKPATLYIWNASDSVPVGLYRLLPIGELSVTDLVAVQAPEPLATFLADRGYLPRGVPMLKRVLALPGQTVCRNARTITVDEIAMGEARDRDSRGRSLPVWRGCRVVAENELFLMNWQSGNSFDGRYFGVISRADVVARAQPVWAAEH
jgi:conjugative transfer signal peptidase TraF